MNAVIYARYSSDSQKDESIDGQIRVCRAYAEAHDMTVVGVYPDPAMTGTNADRPKFQEMIQDAEKGLFESVIVWKLDRFSRDRYDAALYKHRLKKCGVRVISATESIPDDPTGIILESLLEGMAEYYSANLSQNIRRGNVDSAMQGSALGHRCYGYDWDQFGAYVINESEAEIVRRTFREFAGGKSAKEIIDGLNADGIRSRSGKKIDHCFVNRVIRNEKYNGVYKYNGIDCPIPRIVDVDLWKEANDRMNQRRNKHSAKNDFLLSGKIVCGECHHSYVGTGGTSMTGKVFLYYACKEKLAGGDCDMPRIAKDQIERAVMKALIDFVNNDEIIDRIAEDCETAQGQKDNLALRELEKRKRQAETAIQNILTVIEVNPDPALVSRINDRREEIASLDAAIAEEKRKNFVVTAPMIKAFFRHLAGEPSDPTYCHRLVDTFVNKIIIYKNSPAVLVLNTTGKSLKINLSEIDSAAAECKSSNADSLPPPYAVNLNSIIVFFSI